MSDNALQIVTEPVKQAACPKCGMVLDVTGLEPFTRIQCPKCQTEFQVPAKFGNFLLLKLLGMGGMGGVYRAQDEGLKRQVAIKVIQKALGSDPKFIESFQHEAQAAAQLNHPHIAQIYSFGQVAAQPYIAMELVSGGSLDKMMTNGPIDPTLGLDIGRQIAEGLSEATAAGLVHGDVKPENILFDNDQNAKLVDFGIAAMHGSSSSEIWGTPYYIAPEKVQKLKCDQRADIYSLGATLYHAIAGVPPFDGVDAPAVVKARFAGPAKPLKEVNKATPDAVNDIIMRMLELDPRKRYPTYDSLLTDMKHYLSKSRPIKSVPVKSKRIVIKGKKPTFVLPGADGKPLPDGMVPIDQAEEEAPEEEDTGANHRGCKIAAMIGGGVLLLIIILATTAVLILHSKKVSREKEKIEKFETARAAVPPRFENSLAGARKLEERTAAFLPDAKKLTEEASAAALAVLGDSFKSLLIPSEPAAERFDIPVAFGVKAPAGEPPAAVSTNPAAATTNAPAAKVPNLTMADIAKLKDALAKAGIKDLNAKTPPKVTPADLKKLLDALKTAGITNYTPAKVIEMMKDEASLTNAIAAAQSAAAAAAKPAAEEKPAEGEGEANENDPIRKYPVIKTVAGLYADYYFVKQAADLATAWRESLEKDVEEGKKRLAALTPEQEADIITIANAVIGKYNDMNAVRAFTEVNRKVSQMKKAMDGIKVELASIQSQRKEEEAAKAKLAAKAAAEAKVKAEKEAEAAKAQEEAAKIATVEQENVKLLKKGEFRDALRALRDFSPETDGGQNALLTAQDRIRRVEAFHNYLVKQSPQYKSARGWTITAADQKTLSVGNQKLKWEVIYETRSDVIFELIAGLVLNSKATQDMRIREKSRLYTNTALVLSLFYPEMPPVVNQAKKLAKQAVETFENDTDEIKSLLPAFFKD